MDGAASPEAFRSVMGLFPTGITVLTSIGESGPAGLTANALASLSLRPMLLMVALDLKSRTLIAVRESERFALNFLWSTQERESRLFASKAPEREKFAAVGYEVYLETALLHGAMGWMICDVEALHPGGDHQIVVGRVLAMSVLPELPAPLVFFQSRYLGLDAS